MTITHHPDAALLRAHSAGHLPQAFDMVITAHLALCDACRARVDRHDATHGAALEATTPVDMQPDALARTLARIEASQATPEVSDPLADYIGDDLRAVQWRPVGMGVKQAILKTSRGATARLMKIPAGAALPAHSHHGRELTLVLQGAFADGGQVYRRGDLALADSEVSHTPTALAGAECICLIATEAPLRFQNWLPRAVQRFLRI